jgi:predicted transcriptional regulator
MRGSSTNRQTEQAHPMTKLLDQALKAAQTLPEDAQDEIARVVLELAGLDQQAIPVLTDEERRAIDASKAAAARGEFASHDEVAAVWAKHGL